MVKSDDVLLTVAEAAERLGITRNMLYEWLRPVFIPHYRLGPQERIIRLREDDLEAFIEKAGPGWRRRNGLGARH